MSLPGPTPPPAGSDAEYALKGEAPPMSETDPRPREEREAAAWAELITLGHSAPEGLTDQMQPPGAAQAPPSPDPPVPDPPPEP